MPSRICTKSFNALSLQADCVKSLAGGCFAMLCFSLSCFSFQRLDGGCLALVGFFAAFVSTMARHFAFKPLTHSLPDRHQRLHRT
jgi:hypothetical protein